MSVRMVISNPVDETERKLSVPVCPEAIYEEFFHPVARKLNLDLCNNWGTFNEFESDCLATFSDQINLLISEISKNEEISKDFMSHYKDRFKWLLEEMKLAAGRRSGVVFYIG